MEQQEQQRVNEAADQFTDALVQSYRALAESGISVQEQNAQVSEAFFNRVDAGDDTRVVQDRRA